MLFGLFALAFAPTPEPAPPYPREYQLQWTAPAECPDLENIAARIADLRLDHEGHGTMQVTAVVDAAGDGRYSLELRTEFAGVVDERFDEADSCEQLADATALVVAVALTPVNAREQLDSATRVPAPPPPSEEPEPEPTSAPGGGQPDMRRATSLPARADAAPSRGRPPPKASLRMSVGPEWGALGGIAATAGASIGVVWPRMRLDLTGRWIGVRRQDGPPGTVVRTQQGMLAPRICATPGAAAWSFPLCVGAEAGLVRLATRGFDRPSPRHGPWLAPIVDVAAIRTVGPVRVGVELEAAVPVLATGALSDGARFFAPGPISIRGLAVVEIVFP